MNPVHPPNDGREQHYRRAALNRRLRRAFIEGAEEESRRRHGRGLAAAELIQVLRRNPGDVGEPDVGSPH